ncbi:MAG: CheR family methyltransferase [Pseudomonadota bacterium]
MKEIAKIDKKSATRLCDIAYRESGLIINDDSGEFLENRLVPELKKNGLSSFDEYCRFLNSIGNDSAEMKDFINKLTTNTTSFFRERHHFDWIENTGVLEFLEQKRKTTLKVWSVACSSGQELYSALISIEKYRRENQINFDYQGLGTDISTKVLSAAANGIYDANSVSPISDDIKSWCLLKSKKSELRYRINDNIRHRASWKRVNLSNQSMDVPNDFNIIFLRNVLIYFDEKLKRQILRSVLSKLNSNGVLMLGHSETASLDDLGLELVAPTMYRKKGLGDIW